MSLVLVFFVIIVILVLVTDFSRSGRQVVTLDGVVFGCRKIIRDRIAVYSHGFLLKRPGLPGR